RRFKLPRPMIGRDGCDFSFSGLKTAIRRAAEAGAPVTDRDIADICAGFQAAVADVVVDRTGAAMTIFAGSARTPRHLVVAGGVAANRALRQSLAALCARRDFRLVVAEPALCTDNAAMIAWAGAERLALGLTDGLDASARPRWPL